MSDFLLPRPRNNGPRTALAKSLQTQRQVLWALMLHDIKSRFFGNGLGYIVTILWPATHISIIIAAFVIGKRPIPYGSSALLYASTCVLPFIAWNYMSRFTMMGMVQNRSFMAYPVIKPLDMMFARLALEHVSIFIITVGLVATNILFQVDVIPLNLSDAVCGLLSAVLPFHVVPVMAFAMAERLGSTCPFQANPPSTTMTWCMTPSCSRTSTVPILSCVGAPPPPSASLSSILAVGRSRPPSLCSWTRCMTRPRRSSPASCRVGRAPVILSQSERSSSVFRVRS